jgi:hypothetical protein
MKRRPRVEGAEALEPAACDPVALALRLVPGHTRASGPAAPIPG